MGNCQAIDNATLLIQHPNGRVDKHYFPVPASEIMKSNPGHYVALLLTTTVYSSSEISNKDHQIKGDIKSGNDDNKNNHLPLRVTRIKLLRPSDLLVLGHVYRLVTSQEVMKGLRAKKQAKIIQQKQNQQHGGNEEKCRNMTEKPSTLDDEEQSSDEKKVITRERQRSRSHNNTVNSAASSKSRMWQPSLNSISEAAGT